MHCRPKSLYFRFSLWWRNAIKHGGRCWPGASARCESELSGRLAESGSRFLNSGMFVAGSGDAPGIRTGVGLANVRKRLALYYGDDYGVDNASHNNVTAVRFSISDLRETPRPLTGVSRPLSGGDRYFIRSELCSLTGAC